MNQPEIHSNEYICHFFKRYQNMRSFRFQKLTFQKINAPPNIPTNFISVIKIDFEGYRSIPEQKWVRSDFDG